MRILCALGLGAVLLGAPTASAYFLDGTLLVEKMREYEKAQVSDVNAEYDKAAFFQAFVMGVSDTADDLIICMPHRSTVGQACNVVIKYLKENPELWNLPANLLVLKALKQAFPCPDAKTRAIPRPSGKTPPGLLFTPVGKPYTRG